MSRRYRSTGSPVADIEQAIARNESIDQICADLNVRPALVFSVMRRMDLAVHQADEHHDIIPDLPEKMHGHAGAAARFADIIRARAAEGLYDWQIAVELGISPGYVGTIRRDHGIPGARESAQGRSA